MIKNTNIFLSEGKLRERRFRMMDIYLNILIILFALIAFFIYYLLTTENKNRRKQRIIKSQNELEVADELNPKSSFTGNSSDSKNKINTSNNNRYNLPSSYNKTFIRLFSRDPDWLYTYWEVSNDEYYNNQPLLRIYNKHNGDYKDIEISHDTQDWYISNIEPENTYQVVIGYQNNGTFFPLAESNTVTTPPNQPSSIIDEEWMLIEELDSYSYRVNVGSISFVKGFEKKKIEKELEADSYTIYEENRNKPH
ncbi:DUF4912 domain-containing protein [Halothermothrix orenii]|uniref:DUF4912 domain-containing protein n=1 Tax=Halothermothrix orenii (strain H 168 / OCM 544 / DSM 9562) TaxID=373903 RepID=B8CYI1_HALOH|nr:DUF4912 domain-containing protein [Halothermothrix orenii]ACL70350.1 hypothetical protein Hore_16010 [Halothermothrix orenii H 168]